MKERPILKAAIILTIIIEIVLMVLVYNKIGDERLPIQIGRLFFQFIMITFILIGKSNTSLFLLTAYHIISGLFLWNSGNTIDLFIQSLMIYHFIIGLIIYFHDWFESRLNLNRK